MEVWQRNAGMQCQRQARATLYDRRWSASKHQREARRGESNGSGLRPCLRGSHQDGATLHTQTQTQTAAAHVECEEPWPAERWETLHIRPRRQNGLFINEGDACAPLSLSFTPLAPHTSRAQQRDGARRDLGTGAAAGQTASVHHSDTINPTRPSQNNSHH
ncbi:hypothetical protein ROHU_023905 [Labeo rohita]|uniref:Uncharacterized protein n=1 Tax=Labeo rohita TaxID=84645 RepID=A0A498MPP5_LABRO|nr:hypothetical protein ROHU_023905 [Labeo rohita]